MVGKRSISRVLSGGKKIKIKRFIWREKDQYQELEWGMFGRVVRGFSYGIG